jgi:hypothetical protein
MFLQMKLFPSSPAAFPGKKKDEPISSPFSHEELFFDAKVKP